MRRPILMLTAALLGAPALAMAQSSGGGKLLLIGGVSSIDGAAGGGGVRPWRERRTDRRRT